MNDGVSISGRTLLPGIFNSHSSAEKSALEIVEDASNVCLTRERTLIVDPSAVRSL